jgi:hypothetical protein
MSPKKLKTFEQEGKAWTIDPRLREFRHLVFGEMPEFVPFDSERGEELMEAIASR